MSTEVQNILAIPESLAAGSGGYTVPANKYVYVNMTSACHFYGASKQNANIYSGPNNFGIALSGSSNQGNI